MPGGVGIGAGAATAIVRRPKSPSRLAPKCVAEVFMISTTSLKARIEAGE